VSKTLLRNYSTGVNNTVKANLTGVNDTHDVNDPVITTTLTRTTTLAIIMTPAIKTLAITKPAITTTPI
jgi:hypothetical protein